MSTRLAASSGYQLNYTNGTAMEMYTYCDIMGGQSGSPVYATWSPERYPSVVAVVSAESKTSNYFAGGSLMTGLISRARAEYP